MTRILAASFALALFATAALAAEPKDIVHAPMQAEGPQKPAPPTAEEQAKAELAQCRAVLRAIGQSDTTRAGQLFTLAGPEGK